MLPDCGIVTEAGADSSDESELRIEMATGPAGSGNSEMVAVAVDPSLSVDGINVRVMVGLPAPRKVWPELMLPGLAAPGDRQAKSE